MKKPTPYPSEAPIVSLYATAVCGGTTFKCNPQSEIAQKTATYGVRCCNEIFFQYRRRSSAAMCGEVLELETPGVV